MISCEYYKIFKNNFYYRTPLGTASVLRTIRILNFNRFLENMRTMDDLNFANFLSDRVMGGASYCCASYCCLTNLLLEIYFRKIAAFAYSRLSGRCHLLLLSQSFFKQLLPECLTDKFC